MTRVHPALIACLLITAILVHSPLRADEIHEAVKSGELAKVKALLESNPALVKAKDGDGRTPLHWACRGTSHEIVSYLVGMGSDVAALDNNQVAPLHSLAVRNLVREASLLIAKGADVNVLNYDRQTPLHFAASSNHPDMAGLLLKNKAQLEIKDHWGRTPLVLGARERGGPELIKLLLDSGADANAVDKFGGTALSLAAWRGKEEVVNILLNAGAEVPSHKHQAGMLLIQASSHGLENLFDKMVANGAELTQKLQSGGTLLHEAGGGDSIRIVNKLIGSGLDINQKDLYGWTPLHYAAKNGRHEVAAFLIKKGADINARSIMGQSPFNVAAEFKQTEVIDLLTTKGADQSPLVFPILEGDYLGQKPPKDKPELFARGIVSSIWGLHSSAAFSPEGTMVLWTPMVWIPGAIYSQGVIYMMTKKGQRWLPPEIAPFSGTHDDDVPFFAPDGKRLYFISSRPLPGITNSEKERIWYVDKTAEGWTEAKPVDPVVNDKPMHWQFSVDAKGSIYFASTSAQGFGGEDIYCAAFENGRYTEPKNLGPTINTDKLEGTPFIAPDGSYLIFHRNMDLFLSFRKQDGAWAEAKSMGVPINSPGYELCPLLTPDGKYLLYISTRGGENHIWWVDAAVIERVKSGE